MTARREGWQRVKAWPRLAWAVFALSLVVYILTLQKDVLPADSGEFQLVASQLGVAHPPGYPLYTMVGKLFTLLAPGCPALGLNLMSAVLAAAALALTFAAVRRLVGGPAGTWGGLAAALALGTSTTFWAQATTANIRMPTMFFMAWCLYEVTGFKLSSASHPLHEPALTRFALALSLGLGHYPALAFVGLFLCMYLVLVDPALLRTPRRWLAPLAIFGLGQLVWLYLPIRGAMGALFAPPNLATLPGFWHHVSMRGFAGDMFAFAGPQYLPARAALAPMLFSFQFNTALLVASALGAAVVVWRDWRMAVLLLGGWAAQVFITLTYRAPQTVEYLMPAYILQVAALGIGTGWLVEGARARADGRVALGAAARLVLAAGILLAGLLNGAEHAPGYTQLAGDRSTREYVAPVLQQAPPNALVLADWHWATPMQYLQIVEGVRPDVEVEYVYPLGDVEYPIRWLQRIDEEIARRPVLVTHYFGIEYSATRYTFQPLGRAFRVLDRPSYDLPVGLTPTQVDFEGQVGVAGYQLDRSTFHAGQAIELSLVWRPLAPFDHAYSFTVHVLDAAGRHVAQRDLALPLKTYTPGEVRVEQFVLPLASEWPPGRYRLMVGVYYGLPEGGWLNLQPSSSGADEQTLALLGEIRLDPSTEPPLTLHPLNATFEDGLQLVGVDYDRSDPATLRVYLHWRQRQAADRPAGRKALARLQAGDAVDEQALPDTASGSYFTTAHDLAAKSAGGAVSLAVRDEGGAPIKVIGIWGVAQANLALPPPAPGARYVLLGDQLALVGVSARPAALDPGGELQLDLAFVAQRSLVGDNSLSVRLLHQEGVWWLAQDTKPALDMLRTFKWIAGSRVTDSHRFDLPPDAAPGWAGAHLKVYDEFRQAILPPLDTRMGDSVLLGTWEVRPK